MSKVRVLVGTRKGAFVLSADASRKQWKVNGPQFAGSEIYHLKGSPANPEVEVEVPTDSGTEKFKARAHVVDDRAERDRLYEEMTKIWPPSADYQKRTDRLIPVVRLERHD